MPRRTPPQVHVQIEPRYQGRVSAARLRQAARAALAQQGAPEAGALTVRVTGDGELRRLNREFLGHDYATDVLSFPAEAEADGAPYLGDLALSLPRAAAQARAGGHSLLAELQLLVVHGVLHLLGHDHATPRQTARMWRAQAEILAGLGAPITGPAAANLAPAKPAQR